MSARSTPDGRNSSLGRDTRMQLFVGNLPYRVRWQDLKDLFRKAGTVLRADVSLGPDNRSRGYGTVLFGNADDAARAVEMFNGYSWQSRTLEVRPDRLPPDFDAGMTARSRAVAYGLHVRRAPRPQRLGAHAIRRQRHLDRSSALPFPQLPFHCQWQDLKDLFRQAGSVMRADVVLGPDGRSRGHGTVSFANDADAENAVKMFNGCV
ncbi:RNA-binding domain-containing protein, partial [Exidia glandulosa HHB12029]